MSDDLLRRATQALREEGGKEPSPERSSLVRARLLSQTKRRAQLRPQGIWQWAAVVCLGFFVSTAMAHVIKVQLPRVIEALRNDPPAPPKAAPKRARPAQPKAAVPEAPAPAPASPSEAAQPAVANSAPSVPAQPASPSEAAQPAVANSAPSVGPQPAAPTRKPRPAKTAPRPAPKPPAPSPAPTALAAVLPEDEPPPPPEAAPSKPQPAESAELTLFRRAQSLHLSKDPKAIAAWDAYLRVAGTSALAPEARYNRALGLVRASRFTEAKTALAPFAEGKYGTYRREEAQALLSRLPK